MSEDRRLSIGDEQTCSLDNDSIVVFDLFCFCDVLEESFLVLFSPGEEDEEEEEEDVEEAVWPNIALIVRWDFSEDDEEEKENEGEKRAAPSLKKECHSHIAPFDKKEWHSSFALNLGSGARERRSKECRSLTHC